MIELTEERRLNVNMRLFILGFCAALVCCGGDDSGSSTDAAPPQADAASFDAAPTCPLGQSCDDGDACTTGTTCQADGACSGGEPVVFDDVNIINDEGSGLEVTATQPSWQTVTIENTGQLAVVTFQAAQFPCLPTEPLVIEIYATDGDGLPTNTLLAQRILAPADVPANASPVPTLDVDFSANALAVTAGDVLAFKMSTDAPLPDADDCNYTWEAIGSEYAGGTGYIFETPSASGRDMSMSVTVACVSSL